jgi:acyl-CoA thioesterase I
MHNIICFGDSITAANNFAETDRWPTVLGSMLEEWAPESFRVFNRGIGGNTSAQGLNRLESDALAFLPGTVLIEFGLNDANVHPWLRVPRVSPGEFRRNLREMHRAIRERKGEAVFIVNHTISRKGAEGQGNGKAYATNLDRKSVV